MSHEVSLTPENHGYTIRLVKRSFQNVKDKGSVETAETVGTLMIEYDKQKAEAALADRKLSSQIASPSSQRAIS